MTGNGLRPLRTTSKRRRSTPRSPSEYGSSPQGDHTGDTPIGAEMGIENPDYATHETIETETSASRRSSLETKKERKRSRKACDNCKAKKRKCSGNQDCDACKAEGIICHFTHVHPNEAKVTYTAQQMASSQQKCELLEWNLKELHARYLMAVQPEGCPKNYGSGAELLTWLRTDPVTGPPPALSSRMSGSENVKLPRHMGGFQARRPTTQRNQVIETPLEIEFSGAADDFDGSKTNEAVEMIDMIEPGSPTQTYLDQSSTLIQQFQPLPSGQEVSHVANNPGPQLDFTLAPQFLYEAEPDWEGYFQTLRIPNYQEPPRDQ